MNCDYCLQPIDPENWWTLTDIGGDFDFQECAREYRNQTIYPYMMPMSQWEKVHGYRNRKDSTTTGERDSDSNGDNVS